jgi:anaerobic selenocysteine-containing dehydrogenase
MAHVILEKGLGDSEFSREWTHGLEEFKEYVKRFPPQEVEKITWVKAREIERLGVDFCRLKTAPFLHTGLEYTDSGVQNIRAALILLALSGNLDQPGGLVFRMTQPLPIRRNLISRPEGKGAIGSDRHPLYCDLNKSGHFMEVPQARPLSHKGINHPGRFDYHLLPKPGLLATCFQVP